MTINYFMSRFKNKAAGIFASTARRFARWPGANDFLKRTADWMEKMSVAGAGIGLFQQLFQQGNFGLECIGAGFVFLVLAYILDNARRKL